MGKSNKPIKIEVEFTEGYEQRFTLEIMKMYERRKRRQEKETHSNSLESTSGQALIRL